jgi:methyl-accepting chemotaxis protein
LFDELNESVEKSSEKLSGVIDALGQLTTVKDQMVEIVMNIYKVAEQSASASEEVSASVEEQSASMEEISGMAQQLQEHAESLKETMKRFTL